MNSNQNISVPHNLELFQKRHSVRELSDRDLELTGGLQSLDQSPQV